MRSGRSGSAWTDRQDTPQEARYSERAPSAPITGGETVHCTQYSVRPEGAPKRAPKMSHTAAGGLGSAASGRAHHIHLPRLARDGLAHLCTDPGVGSAPGQASSSPLSTKPSIRFCLDRHPGHSSGSALFRKGTFGADKGRDRTLYTVQCTPRGAPNGAPDLSVYAGAGLGVASSGRAHHPHLCSLATDGLAHLCTDSGAGSARARVSSSSLSAEPSIQ